MGFNLRLSTISPEAAAPVAGFQILHRLPVRIVRPCGMFVSSRRSFAPSRLGPNLSNGSACMEAVAEAKRQLDQ